MFSYPQKFIFILQIKISVRSPDNV